MIVYQKKHRNAVSRWVRISKKQMIKELNVDLKTVKIATSGFVCPHCKLEINRQSSLASIELIMEALSRDHIVLTDWAAYRQK